MQTTYRMKARSTERTQKFGKDPKVNTSFLPDKDREEKDVKERQRLTEEWTAEQERIKAETIEVTYSYWDGSGHRRELRCAISLSLSLSHSLTLSG
jgi:protein FAM50